MGLDAISPRIPLQKSGDAAEPLLIFTPNTISEFLDLFSARFESIKEEIQVIDCATWHSGQLLRKPLIHETLNCLYMDEIKIVPVVHCPHAYGISLTAKTGWKICYSGDTMRSENLIDAGMGCDLLIHEATMEDNMEEVRSID